MRSNVHSNRSSNEPHVHLTNKYLSIFEHIQSTFKEHLANVFNVSNAKKISGHVCPSQPFWTFDPLQTFNMTILPRFSVPCPKWHYTFDFDTLNWCLLLLF
jgi:hypothetical protein